MTHIPIIRYDFDEIHSTNGWMKEHASSFTSYALTVVTARTQTGGRGRLGRIWLSPPSVNLYLSLGIFLEKNSTKMGHLCQVLALSVVKALRDLDMNIQPRLKWPNDIILNGKKLGGILGETVLLSHQLFFIVGLGLNVNMSEEDFKALNRPATSLKIETGRSFDIEQVLQRILQKFIPSLHLFLDRGFDPFFEDFKIHSLHKAGDSITFSHGDRILEGTFLSYHSDGSILLESKEGIKTFHSGEFIY